MEIQQLNEISEKIYSDLKALLPADLNVVEDILKKESIKYGKIRTFNLEDSQDIALLTMKQNCLILIKYLLENEIKVSNSLLDSIYNLVNLKSKYITTQNINDLSDQGKNVDLHAQMEKERIIDCIHNLLIDIVFISKYKSDVLINFLKNKKIPDEFSVNLAIAIDQDLDFESFELTVLSKKLFGPVFLSMAKSYKNSMRKFSKKKIVKIAEKYISSRERNISFELFYYLNEESNKSILINTKPENIPEYFGFVSSLIVNKDDADIAYSKLEPFFDNLADALQILLSFPKNEEKSIQPADEKMIKSLLECLNNISKFQTVHFFKFIKLFQEILKIKISSEVKGVIYDILSKYLNERDVFVEKVIECRDSVEKEIKTKNFYLLPRLIKFLNAYHKREQRETELINAGMISGSPYVSSVDKTDGSLDLPERYDFRILGLKSEDPMTIIESLDCYIDPNVLSLYSFHIRNAMIKDTSVIDRMIDFQIDYNLPLDDILILNSIISHSSPRFFEYVKLFKDFSFYLNSDVLERISEDPERGIKWFKDCYNKEIGQFILQNCGYFNVLLKENISIQSDLIQIYEKIFDENLGDVQIKLFKENINFDTHDSVFYLYDTQELLSEAFFSLFSKQLIYYKFYQSIDNINSVLLKQYVSPYYSKYIKTKAICGLDISSDIVFMKKNLLADDDLLGYVKIVGCYTPETEIRSPNILLSFNIKDNSIFLKNFIGASDFEKFILFFNIEYVTKEIDFIIKEEIMKNLKTLNRLYLRMCVLQLFKTREIDQILKILEKNFEDKELLLKLSIHNIINGGRYFSKDLIQYGDEKLKNQALFLLYYLNIWDKEYLKEMIEKVDVEASEDMRYLMNDVGKY